MSSVCTGLKTNWTSTMKTAAQFPVDSGTVVEVACSEDDTTLMGDRKVTCTLGRDFSYLNEPWCLGIFPHHFLYIGLSLLST